MFKISLQNNEKWIFYTSIVNKVKEQDYDCQLVVDGITIHCHRLILSAASTVFAKHFASKSPRSQIVLFGIKYRDMNDLIRYIYTGNLAIEDKARVAAIKKVSKTLGFIVPIPNYIFKIKTKPDQQEISMPKNDQVITIDDDDDDDDQGDSLVKQISEESHSSANSSTTTLSANDLQKKNSEDEIQTEIDVRDLYEPNGVPKLLHALKLMRTPAGFKVGNFLDKAAESIHVARQHLSEMENESNKRSSNDSTPSSRRLRLRSRIRKPNYQEGTSVKKNITGKCRYCNIIYVLLTRHEGLCRMNPARRSNACPVCIKTFTRQENVIRHVKGVHKWSNTRISNFKKNLKKA